MTDNGNNYEVFRDCVSGAIVQKSQGARKKSGKRKPKGYKRRNEISTKAIQSEEESSGVEKQDPEELAEFIDV